MTSQLRVSIGQHTDKGRKEINQDFHGAYCPEDHLLATKGIALALADGISSSNVSQIASESAVTGFLSDYFCTSETWTVKKSAQRVLIATNSWLHAQTQHSQYRFDKNRGYVCTFSSIVIKSTTAHIFHVGDARIFRLNASGFEQLTNDHRVWISQEENYLSRALGIHPRLEVDYLSLQVEKGDIFFLATDGVYEFVSTNFISSSIHKNKSDLDQAAKTIITEAYNNHSTDNLTAQIVRIDELPEQNVTEIYQQLSELPLPPTLSARMEFDKYEIIREIHSSSRSHVYLAKDTQNGKTVVLKTPSVDQQDDTVYLERFLTEEWIARRINNPHVLKPCEIKRQRNFLYIVMEYIEGQALSQWMVDNPKPDLETVREIIEQVAKGLTAFHRLEMLHQDLRPENIMIDRAGTVKIIDFGSTRVAGLSEITSPLVPDQIMGTAQYTAPEYFLGESATSRSDLFSLAVITYQMLSGELPYGTLIARTRSRAAQNKLAYKTVLTEEREIPAWIDEVLKKALHINPLKRYDEVSEFVYKLRYPSQAYLNRNRPPLMERNPVVFWQSISLILAVIVLFQLFKGAN